jgi:hypothetical protein
MTYERRGDFSGKWRQLSEEHFPPSEVKWQKVKKKTLPFFEALVDWFFETNWLMFHCLVVARADVDMTHHRDIDQQRMKHFTMLLANKVHRFSSPGKVYRIRVDPLASRYKKADETAEKVLRNTLEKRAGLQGTHTIHDLLTVDSRDTPGVQLSDLLLGAVLAARQGEVTAGPKLQLIARIADHLGWPDLESDTYPRVQKFNIWRFWDPTSGTPRPEDTRRRVRVP